MEQVTSDKEETSDEVEEEYVVEEIIKKYNSKEGRYEYRVKWKEYSSVYNTWELESNIPNELLIEFEKKNIVGCSSTTEPSQAYALRDRSKRKTTFNSDYVFD